MTTPTIRAIDPDELPDFARAVALGFGETASDAFIDMLRGATEFDRTLAAMEGSRIVGTAETISFAMGLPGARPARCAGLTSVGVHPSRRRRGLLSALMTRQLADAHERGEAFGALYASEARIYGRFGYGAAGPAVNLTIDTPWARLHDSPEALVDVDLISVEEALRQLPPMYDRVAATTPGMMSRSPERWNAMMTFSNERHRGGFTPYFVAVLADRGYVLYRLKEGWRDGVADGTVRIIELVAADADAQAALWSYCARMDLMAHLEANHRPPDDPVRMGLADPMRLRVAVAEPLWVRLLSLPDAVVARGYAASAEVVVDVRDASCPWNAGTWRLELDPEGAACTRSDAAPDLSLDTGELASAFLGGVRLTTLVRARRVAEHRAGAAWALDRALASDPLPWNPRIF